MIDDINYGIYLNNEIKIVCQLSNFKIILELQVIGFKSINWIWIRESNFLILDIEKEEKIVVK